MAYATLSASNSPTVLDDFVKKNLISDKFSLCFNSNGTGGKMILGGIPDGYDNKIEYVPLYTNHTPYYYYSVFMKDFLVDGNSLGLPSSIYNSKNCITDTGTPTLTVPSKVYSTLSYAFSLMCSSANLHGICDVKPGQTLFDGNCFNYTHGEISVFPTLTLVLNNSQIMYAPEQYLRPLNYICNDTTSLGLAIWNDPSGFGTVIGLSVLQNYVTVYDRVNEKIGFAPNKGC